MKINRYLISALCLLASAVIAFVVLPRFYANRNSTTTVCRAAAAIPKGTLIEEKHITTAEVGAFNLPESVIKDSADILGKYALSDIPKDDIFMPEKTGEFLFSETLDALMDKNQKLVTVTLSGIAAGVSGHLMPGDIVSAVSYIEETLETDSETGADVRVNIPARTLIYPELRNITVFGVENSKAESVDDAREQGGLSADPVPKTVTLIVTERQALKLVEAEYSGKIHLIFERRDS